MTRLVTAVLEADPQFEKTANWGLAAKAFGRGAARIAPKLLSSKGRTAVGRLGSRKAMQAMAKHTPQLHSGIKTTGRVLDAANKAVPGVVGATGKGALGFGAIEGAIGAATAEEGERLKGFGKGFASGAATGAIYSGASHAATSGLKAMRNKGLSSLASTAGASGAGAAKQMGKDVAARGFRGNVADLATGKGQLGRAGSALALGTSGLPGFLIADEVGGRLSGTGSLRSMFAGDGQAHGQPQQPQPAQQPQQYYQQPQQFQQPTPKVAALQEDLMELPNITDNISAQNVGASLGLLSAGGGTGLALQSYTPASTKGRVVKALAPMVAGTLGSTMGGAVGNRWFPNESQTRVRKLKDIDLDQLSQDYAKVPQQ